mmetsp:Transcript_52790/g.63621  ORF Transcript_52790/g.63621 Transcript_52790/m.63621 type:complete len:467 (-) Transcript_52790:115-1515(-)
MMSMKSSLTSMLRSSSTRESRLMPRTSSPVLSLTSDHSRYRFLFTIVSFVNVGFCFATLDHGIIIKNATDEAGHFDQIIDVKPNTLMKGEAAFSFSEDYEMNSIHSGLRGFDSSSEIRRILAVKWGPIRSKKKGGYCLQPADKKSQDGALVFMRPCDNSKAQLWQYTGTSSSGGQIKSRINTNKCIEVKSNKKNLIKTCNGSNDQTWVFSDNIVYFKKKGNKKVWSWPDNLNGKPVTLSDYKSNSKDQKFIFDQFSKKEKDSGNESKNSEEETVSKNTNLNPITKSGGESANKNTETASGLWVEAHNSRRQKYHQQYGKEYVPVKWSQSLADEAQNYADKLASTCKFEHYKYGESYGGENLACNWKSGDIDDGDNEDEVLKRWTEDEEELDWVKNGHFTQVLWRSTKYIGCAEGINLGCNKCTHYHVCRYLEPGNCDVSDNGSNWRSQMLKDSVGCRPRCPLDGCF